MLFDLNLDVKNMDTRDGMATYHQDSDIIYGLTNPEHETWKSIGYTEPHTCFYCKKIEPGIYETGLNFEHDISGYTNFEAYGSYEQLSKEGIPIESRDWNAIMNGLSPYGVADSIDQIKEKYQEMINSENPIVISVTEMRKDEQPEDGGWRWHKWGEYIGKKEPQCEYLYDEPNIDSVYVFHIYAVRPKLEKKLENKKPKM